jgi:hypothetical protein
MNSPEKSFYVIDVSDYTPTFRFSFFKPFLQAESLLAKEPKITSKKKIIVSGFPSLVPS